MSHKEKTADTGNFSICIVGAGPSGLCAAVLLCTKFNAKNLTIFEENEDVGGCWLANRYPGCACDVESHLYSYSFEPNPYWSKAFAPQKEILEYFRSVAKKNDIYSKTHFQHSVKLAEWDEESSKWNVTVLDKRSGKETTHAFNIFVSAAGVFRSPKIAEIFNNFGGPIIHSAKWDSTVDLKDKVIAVVGSGSSAVQIIPNIAKYVKTLVSYQRRPAWVLAKMEMNFPPLVQWGFANTPGMIWAYRNLMFYVNDARQAAFKADSYMQKLAMWTSKQFMRLFIKDPNLQQRLTPNYPFGCKQVGLSNTYYSALSKPHVKVICEGISEITKDSIITEDGNCEKPDVLILATGFEVQDHFAPMRIIGAGGQDVWKDWKESRPNLYFGSVCKNMPNAFLILGPNSGIAHNSAIFVMECQTNFMIQVLKKMEERNCKSVAVKKTAVDEYMKDLVEGLNRSAFQAGCNSWHADDKGVVTAIWPHGLAKYYRMTKRVNFDHFEFS